MNWEIIILGCANLGTVVWLGKRVIEAVDKHKEILPSLVSTVDEISRNQAELYERLHRLEGDFRETRGKCDEFRERSR